jgi:hypothetical protein
VRADELAARHEELHVVVTGHGRCTFATEEPGEGRRLHDVVEVEHRRRRLWTRAASNGPASPTTGSTFRSRPFVFFGPEVPFEPGQFRPAHRFSCLLGPGCGHVGLLPYRAGHPDVGPA